MTKRIALIVIIIMLTISLNGHNESKRYEAQFLELFDTMTTIIGYGQKKDEFTRLSQFIYDNLDRYHKLYDVYNNYEGINNIKTINDNAGKNAVKVDSEIIELLKFSKEIYYKTNGKTNIAMGSVLKIWHKYRKEGINNPESSSLPPLDLLKEASSHTDIENIIINEADSTVYLDDPKMSIDLGAVAKGYAAEQVCSKAKANGYNSVVVSVGGNVKTIGEKSDKSPWNIGIQNPDKESDNSSLYSLNIKDLSVVTSGNYQRYYTVDGKQYHHIINPDTLYPADYFTSVTVVCSDSGVADGFSTAIFNMPYNKGLELIKKNNAEALWVFDDGSIKYSDGFLNLLKK